MEIRIPKINCEIPKIELVGFDEMEDMEVEEDGEIEE